MVIIDDEEETKEEESWKMYFDGASNALGHKIGVVMISLGGKYHSFTARLKFDCIIMWLNIKHVFWDSIWPLSKRLRY